MRKILMLLALLVFWSHSAHAQSPALDPSDDVQQVKRHEVDAWLKKEVQASQGNFARDRYLFVFAFNTIQADRNKLGMTAMRRLAFSLLNNSLAPGDQVLPAAWEVDLWDMGKSVITLDSGTQGRNDFAQALQTTHSGKWSTNHDINRSFVSITRSLQAMNVPMASTIILMFTDSGSISANQEEIWGMRHPEYLKALETNGFRDREDSSFPCVASHGHASVNVAIAGFFPKKLQSLPSGGRDRFPTYALESWQPKEDKLAPGETLPNPTLVTPPPPPPPGRAGVSPVLIALLVLLVLGVLFGLSRARHRPAPLPVPVSSPAPPPPALRTLMVTLGLNARPQTLSFPGNQKVSWQIASPAESDSLVLRDLTEPASQEPTEEPPDTPLVDITLDKEGVLLLSAVRGSRIERPSAALEAVTGDPNQYTLKPGGKASFYLQSEIFDDSKRIELNFYQEDPDANPA